MFTLECYNKPLLMGKQKKKERKKETTFASTKRMSEGRKFSQN
jgi:hypothetical protein